MDQRGWTPPFGLKIDVEGFERQVVEGAARFLEQTQFVIAEVSVSPRFEGGASSAEFIALLRSHGFEVLDVLHAAQSRLGLHADLLFGPSAGR
jgi:Methyltransferase FkbM domain